VWVDTAGWLMDAGARAVIVSAWMDGGSERECVWGVIELPCEGLATLMCDKRQSLQRLAGFVGVREVC